MHVIDINMYFNPKHEFLPLHQDFSHFMLFYLRAEKHVCFSLLLRTGS
jgi:hypothetical protein